MWEKLKFIRFGAAKEGVGDVTKKEVKEKKEPTVDQGKLLHGQRTGQRHPRKRATL
jgi:hypothetical protein